MRKTLITVFLFLLTASLCAAVTIEVWEYGMANEFVAIIQELADFGVYSENRYRSEFGGKPL